ncbi:MAG TPA: transposase [Tepidisphaeraceae bacterium]|nr:transposase [Tepidisphaeraceae bacterium]
MPRVARVSPGGMIFHCLNRGNDRRAVFDDPGDYAAFERVLEKTLELVPVRLLAYCLMPNHWHLVLWPRKDGELGAFMQRLTTTHVRRWHRHRHSDGRGHLYQGTYKSFPVQDDRYFLVLARYVERNALRANLAANAQDWQWSSLWRREKGSPKERGILSEWPLPRPANWVQWVNEPQTDKELEAIRESLRRGRPFGEPGWQAATATRLRLESTFRQRGRPKKA